MTNDVKERVARTLIACDSGPVGSTLFNIHAAEFGEGYAAYAEFALAALRPGDEINGCVLVPKSAVSDLVRSITEVRPGEMWTAASFDNFEVFRAMLAAAKKG